eukprot:1565161-Pleurochrysis_carterae.AAC.1
MAPWDMEDIVKRALKSQKGAPELAWHMANWDFKSLYADHIARSFHDYSHQRYWEYQNVEGLEANGGVRVTWRPGLLPAAEAKMPDLRPVERNANGELQTKAEGQVFMTSFPPLSVPPRIEAWKPAEPEDTAEGQSHSAWHKTKVFSHIINHTAAQFPNAQLDQWKALKAFHDQYPSSDVLPPLPLSVSAAAKGGQSWQMRHGAPLDWKAMWERIAWRYD